MELGEWIRHARDRKGWTQNELSFQTRVGVRLIQRWEAGKGDPTVENLVKLGRAFSQAPPQLAEAMSCYLRRAQGLAMARREGWPGGALCGAERHTPQQTTAPQTPRGSLALPGWLPLDPQRTGSERRRGGA